jgi:hypothetical protein
MTAALAPVCWIGGHNKAASFVGSGMGGMGVLNFARFPLSIFGLKINSNTLLDAERVEYHVFRHHPAVLRAGHPVHGFRHYVA